VLLPCLRVSSSTHFSSFFFESSCHHRDLHSFPTRRSSDLVLAIGWYLLNRHVDPNEFEDPVGLKDVVDSNKDYVFMFIVMLLFDCFFIWLIYSDSDYPFPNLGLSDVFTVFLVILFTIYFLCIIVESMIAYCKYLWNVKIRKK